MEDNPLNHIIGLHCIESWCGYAGQLIIDLSSYPDKLALVTDNLSQAEWRFETISAAWRLMSNDVLQTGSSEYAEHNDKRLKYLIGSKVAGVKYNSRTDITIFFDNGFQLETFIQGLGFPPFELCNRVRDNEEFEVIQLTVHGEWKVPENTEFTDLEKIASDHSERTEGRWRFIVPNKSFDNHCKDCAYFLTTSGRFHFWDFGICSNGRSSFDGRAVGIKSSCEQFSLDLDSDE